ncbi:MAG: M28 family peptidase, partial [Myxococcaceae bacterium]|nr:M28 family peptidase [Myxococcaceae bacterium]
MRSKIFALLGLVLSACATTPVGSDSAKAHSAALPQETHFAELHQLTFGGENAEAYWSFDGNSLSLQAHEGHDTCDRIFHMKVLEGGQPVSNPAKVPVSSGKGATTCAHYFPGDKEVLFASTHLGGDACPPKPDMSMGYVWALYDSYDIFKANIDGTGLTQLTTEKGYDAEGTVCSKDGSIIFTSDRDGDIELYRMDKDGKNVKRLTFEPGYDGGAFFNHDCSKIVWRASRPKAGKELDDYQALLAKGLVKPSKLELYVANADGSDARQLTYFNVATFAPFWFPHQNRIIFSSNYPDARGREFDLWAIDADGTHLERITYSKGFDGFPMFSPDGKWLAFSSNRATAEGKRDTNVFLARWADTKPAVEKPSAADRIAADVAWLAAPERQGRGVGTAGLAAAGEWLERQYAAMGLEAAGDNGTFRQAFQVTTSVKQADASSVKVGKDTVPKDNYVPMGFSAQGKMKGKAVLAGWGITDEALGLDDYQGISVKGKWVVVKRFAPEHPKLNTTDAQRSAGDLRKKAFVARSKGAVGMIVVDMPEPAGTLPKDFKLPPEAPLPTLHPEGTGDAGIPVLVVKRAVLEKDWSKLTKGQAIDVALDLALEFQKTDAFNVVAVLKAKMPSGQPPVIVGAHYDHLGFGGRDSLAPDKHEAHVGADDNASGTAALLEIARQLVAVRDTLKRDVVFASFSGEETGVLGSSHAVASHADWVKPGGVMMNLDMVGRLRGNTLNVLGSESAEEWKGLVTQACDEARVRCTASGDGYGPSDHMPFYTAGVPVLHFFTGAHSDYHKPSDTADKVNAAGAGQVAQIVATLAQKIQETKLTFKKSHDPVPRGDVRSFNASLGTVPDYGGPPQGLKGVLLADVRPGGGAEKGGLKRGDVLVRLGKNVVGSVEDLMFVLQQSKPGETVTAVVVRDGKELPLEVTFQ